MLLAVPAASSAQDASVAETESQAPIDFSADQVIYDSDLDVVTATGSVRMNREGNYLAAERIVWDRKSGEVHAQGNVVVLSPQGDRLIGENVVLTDTLRE